MGGYRLRDKGCLRRVMGNVDSRDRGLGLITLPDRDGVRGKFNRGMFLFCIPSPNNPLDLNDDALDPMDDLWDLIR